MQIKICCIQSLEEARLAMNHGAHALGFVSEMPSGPGTIADSEIAEIIEKIPPEFATVLLSSRTDPGAIVEHQRETRANTLQLVAPVTPDDFFRVKELLPGVALVKVVHVKDAESVLLARAYSDAANAILLDTGDPDAEVARLGGTGETHDWTISRQIVETCPVPIILAGGLSSVNVEEAIRSVRPFGVDVCSSLRPEGALQAGLLRDFVACVQRADA